MIFDLPPILGLIPLLLTSILMLVGFDIYLATIAGIVVGAVFTGQTLLSLSTQIYASLGSFLALVGFVIMLGSGLGEVLRKTKIAHNIVVFVLEKVKIKSPAQGIFATMCVSTILVAMLGTVAGSNAIIAPIVIPILATLGTVPGCLGMAFFGGGFAGLILGPFTPNVVTILGVTGMDYTSYLLGGGIPLALIIWVVTYFMAMRLQKKGSSESYSDEDKVSEGFEMTPQIKRGSIVFLVLIILLLAYGVYAKAGAAYSIVVMLITGFACGRAAGMSLKDCVHSIMEGCAKMFKMFFLFVLFDPFLVFIAETGAFEAIANLLQPLIDSGGQIVFMVVTALIGIFGISGASVSQAIVIQELFGPAATALGISMTLWVFNVLVGSILTSFSLPGIDALSALALARSNNVRAVLKMGYTIIIVGIVVLAVRTAIGI